MDWFRTGLLFAVLLLIIILAELIRKRLAVSAEATRKLVHILTGWLIALTPLLLTSALPLLIISGSFVVINSIAIRKHWLPGINSSPQISYGTVFYPASFLILILLLWHNHKSVLVTAMLVLAIADAMAAIIGRSVASPKRYQISGETKSVQGSLAMLATTFLIVVGALYIFLPTDGISLTWPRILWIAAIAAILATVCESISFRGSDNLTVPLGAALVIHYMLTHSTADNLNFTLGIAIALFIAGVSFLLHFLNGSGAVSTFLLGSIVFGIGKWEYSLPILLFFVLSSLLSKLGKQWKQKFAATFQKGGRRDFGQVVANGGVAGLIVLLWNYIPWGGWYFLFVGSIAAVTADTWATEIGVFSRQSPRHVLNFRQVPPGTSGGITLLGLGAAMLGSLVIVFVGGLATNNYAFINNGFQLASLIAVAGFLGSIVDSIIGATIQAQYQCPACGKITEKKIHCQQHRTQVISGYPIIDNDVVNGLCGLSGAFFSWIAYRFLM